MTCCITKDMMPLEKEGFKSLVNALDSRYKLPSRKYLTTKALPDLYSKTRETIMKEVSKAQFISGTTDLWSSSTMDPYISYTVHFVTEDWILSSYYLETLFLHQDHTGENIAEVLESILEAWNLKTDQQVCLTTEYYLCSIHAWLDTTILLWSQLEFSCDKCHQR